jgi:ABC-type uncharacterized transport system involved in gliding motility auxiliary subunit
MNNKWIRFSGIFGLVLFLFGIGGMLITPGGYYEFFLVAHVAIGIGLILFWIAAIGLKNLDSAGSIIKGRTTRFGANALLYGLIVAGIFVSINWIAKKNDKRWDFTAEGVYSLSPYTQKLLENLKAPLKIFAFKINPDSEQLKDLIDLYKAVNPGKVTASLIDPRTKPQLVEKYQMKPGNVVYLEYGEGDKTSVSRIAETSEEGLTNAIIKLTRGSEKKIYYVEGHDEPSIKGADEAGLKQFADEVANEHFSLEEIVLATKQSVPDDAAAVILASPKKPLLPEERDALIKYVEQGGRLLLFHDPRTTPDIKEIAAKFNIKVGDNIVIDQVRRLFSAPALGAQPVIQDYGVHPITRNFSQEDVTIFNIASTVDPVGDTNANGLTVLAKSSATAWGETNIDLLFSENASATKDPEDQGGPLNMVVAYEKKLDAADKNKNENNEKFEKIGRLVVFGDSDFIRNANIGVYANKDFALNSLNWIIGEEGGISIRPKSMKKSDAPMEIATFRSILGTSFIIPEIILLYGLFIWWKRRLVSI